MQIEAIGLGLLISLFFSETLGLAAGGMVVPGYVALMLHHPLRILGTVGVSLATTVPLPWVAVVPLTCTRAPWRTARA